MPTRNISLTPEQDAFVEKVVKSGDYQNASEAVRDALRILQQRRQEDALKLKALRIALKAEIDALGRGDFTEVDETELDGYLEGLTAVRTRARADFDGAVSPLASGASRYKTHPRNQRRTMGIEETQIAAMLAEAMRKVAAGPEGPSTRSHGKVLSGIRSMHMRYARTVSWKPG